MNKAHINLVLVLLFALLNFTANRGQAIELQMNFSVLGEYVRFSFLAFGSAEFNLEIDDQDVAFGLLSTQVAQAPVASGVFAGQTVPTGVNDWGTLDFQFSVPFEMNIDSTSALRASFDISGVRMVMDFHDDVGWFNAANPAQLGPLSNDSRPQGIFLESVTLPGGAPLSSAGLGFDFITENTTLRARASDSDSGGDGGIDEITSGPPIASVNASGVGLAEVEIGGDNLARWSVSYEPNALVADQAAALILNAGIPDPLTQNIRLFTLSSNEPTPGDFNDDGVINAADYTVWRDNLGTSFDLEGNGVNDGIVDQLDYDLWEVNFGTSASSAANIQSVPEPTSTILLTLACGLAGFSRQRK